MKKLYSFLLGLMLIGFSNNSLFAGNKDGKILIVARLSGAQEVPAVTTKAKGLVTFMVDEDYKTVTINGVFDSLSGAVTACHFHAAQAGVAGAVVLDLFSMVKGNRIYGKTVLSKAFMSNIMGANIYINVHTATNPGGEIRGQLKVETDAHFIAGLIGANETPAVTTNASGLGSFVLSPDSKKLEYKLLVTGLSGAVTAAHLHYGATGVAGPVVYGLTVSGRYLSGTLDVSQAFLDSLALGRVYANVHTAANPNGEIRAQLSALTPIAFDAVAIGANEVPATTSNAKAIAVAYLNYTLDSMFYVVMTDSLTATAAHFHAGAAGVNGSVLIGLTGLIGFPQAYSALVAVNPDTLAKILRGEIYLNVHTVTNPNGEIRGQTSTSVRDGIVANLCGGQEAPTPVVTTAVGVGMASVDRNKTNVHVEIVTNGLSGNATASHIHGGAKGAAGSVVINFGAVTANQVSGYFSIPRTTFADSIVGGLAYQNVHTATNAGGEIRGQLGKTLVPECLPTATFELNGQTLSVKIFPNPTADNVNIQFDSPESFDAQIVVSDLIGRQMMSKNVSILRGSNAVELDASVLNHGIYFVQMRDNKRLLFTEKIVKN